MTETLEPGPDPVSQRPYLAHRPLPFRLLVILIWHSGPAQSGLVQKPHCSVPRAGPGAALSPDHTRSVSGTVRLKTTAAAASHGALNPRRPSQSGSSPGSGPGSGSGSGLGHVLAPLQVNPGRAEPLFVRTAAPRALRQINGTYTRAASGLMLHNKSPKQHLSWNPS